MQQKTTLANGLRIVTQEMNSVQSVSVGLWIKTGVLSESSQNNGISHFIEHMVFKGTHKRTAKNIAETVDSVGGHINAFTSREYTCFYVKVLHEDVELAVDILSDMLFNSIFDHREIEKERSVVMEEINMYEDSPEDLVHDMLMETVYPEQAMGFPILGTEKTVSVLNREGLISHLHHHYRPDNSVLSIAGRINELELIELAKRYFGNWGSTGSSFHGSTNDLIFNPGKAAKHKDIEQMHFIIGLEAPAFGTDHMYDLFVINNVLGGSMSSRLFQRIREEHGLAYSIYSEMENYLESGLFMVSCSTSPQHHEQVRHLILKELNDLLDHGISPDEFDKARRQLKGNYLLGMESTSGCMASMGKTELLLGKVETAERILEKLNGLRKEEVEKTMRTYLHIEEMAESVVGPLAEGNN